MAGTTERPRHIGPYEILDPLGRGNMGEVFVARDSRLSRKVAIKLIHESDSDDTRRRRFIQEARSASALNHPNIVTIHDFGTSEGISYIVSELIEGESLRSVLKAGPVPLKRVLDIGVQIAEALSAAHEAGIVHRDLKPENIMISRSGRVKLLDFGLAKPVGPPDAESTLDENLTEPGLIVGTVAYMSPEQARGMPATFQSDQFSLGLMLHEMATGHHPYKRETPMETLLAIATLERPPFTPGPVALRLLIERLMNIEPAKRFANTEEIAERLRKIRRDFSGEIQPRRTRSLTVPRVSRRAAAVVMILLTMLVFGLLLAARAMAPALPSIERIRMEPLPATTPEALDPVWAPDGGLFAFAAGVNGVRQVFIQNREAGGPTQITNAADDCSHPFWINSTRIGFIAGKSLWAVSRTGGTPELLGRNVDVAVAQPGSGHIALLRGGQLIFDRLKLDLPGVTGIRFSPDGAKLGVTGGTGLGILDIATGRVRKALDDVRSFDWLPDSRRILYSDGTHLWSADTAGGSRLRLTNGSGIEDEPVVSPSGSTALVRSCTRRSGLYSVDLASGTPAEAITPGFDEAWPSWSPTRSEYAYVSGGDILLRSATGEWERRIVKGNAPAELRFSPSGLAIAYADQGTVKIAATENQGAVANGNGSGEHSPAWAPDGNSIAYFSGNDLVRRPVASSGQAVRMASAGGKSLAWSPDGGKLAFIGDAPGIAIVSTGSGEIRTTGSGKWLAATWTKSGKLLAGVLREPSGLILATLDPANGQVSKLTRLPPAREVKGVSISSDGRTATVALSDESSRLWLLTGLDGK